MFHNCHVQGIFCFWQFLKVNEFVVVLIKFSLKKKFVCVKVEGLNLINFFK